MSDRGEGRRRPTEPADPPWLTPAQQADLVDLAFDAVFVRQFHQRRIVFWSRGAERLYGFSREAALGTEPAALLRSEYPVPLEEIEAVLAAEGRWEGELHQVSAEGRTLVVHGRWVLQRDDAGEPATIVEINADVTARRRAEARLRASEERFRMLVQGVRDYAIFMLDPGGQVSSWNEGAQRIHGYSEEEIIGSHFSVFYTTADAATGKAQRELHIAATEGRFEEEGWRRRKDGRRFWASVILTALRDDQGELRGFAKITRDMTERRRQQRRLEAMQRREVRDLREHARKLGELERAKTEFLRLASHELRGPLTVIGGYLTMLLDGSIAEVPDDAARILRILLGKSEEMRVMVEQLLEAARLEEGQLELTTRVVDLRGVLQEAAARAAVAAGPAHTVSVEVPPQPVRAAVDNLRMVTVFQNLLDNGVKYSPGGGTVRCTLRTDPATGMVEVEVCDEGLGIAEEDLPRLFTRFGRLVTPANSHIPGTGLGLYLSRELVRRHGGDIRVRSRVGEGSCFTVSVPQSREPD